MNRRSLLALLAAAFVPRRAHATATPRALADATARVTALAKAKKRAFPFAEPSIKIKKKDRVLELYDGKDLVKNYTVALGTTPEGPKTVEGDRKTPEGKYFICWRNDASQFHLFLGLSYPNAADAAAGRKAGLIDAATEKGIAAAEKAKEKPDWYTKLGGAVGVHGGGTGNDWTWGCIALSDEDIDELWAACPVGTPVEIVA
jgi:murein L,D-transpeptidase YafK